MIRAIALAIFVSLAAAAGAQAPADALRVEMVFWESIRGSKDPADYRAYLEQYPNGRFAPLARNRLAALGHPVPPPAAPAAAAAPAVAAAKPAPKPNAPAASPGPLAAGNAWTYRVLDRKGAQRGLQQVTLAAATEDSLIEETLADGANARAEHRKGYYLSPAGNVTLFSPYLVAFGAPPAAGPLGEIEVLDMRTCNAGWTCSVSGRVVGRDRVQVPAGTFEATKIEIVQSWRAPPISYSPGEGVTRTLTVWYAPEVKRAIKFSGRGGPSRSVDTEFDIELVSYRLN